MKKLFMIVNEDIFFLSHRKDIAVRAAADGFDVTVVASDTGHAEEIRALGLRFVALPINKTGLNISEELRTFRFLYSLIRKERPDVVHLVGMKIILWGGLASRLLGVRGIVSSISGLGVMFSPEFSKGIRKVMAWGVLAVMRFIHRRKNVFCVFHNRENMELFVRKGLAVRESCVMTNGSGIDLDMFRYVPEPSSGRIRVLFTARMVEDKGVLVLLEAAERLRKEYEEKAEFVLCGGLETNPLAITRERLESLCDGSYISWLGRRNDIRQQLEQCHVFAFPSYYMEGLPKSCIEAAAVGRPIITCDWTGCRDAVEDGVTGFLIPAKDSGALADKLRLLIEDETLRTRMGRASRAFAEKNFSVDDVVKVHLDMYNRLVLAE